MASSALALAAAELMRPALRQGRIQADRRQQFQCPRTPAGGIGQALISTAAGLCVAIPAVMFHRYLRGRVTAYIIEMEKQAMALLDALDPGTSTPTRSRAGSKRSSAA